MKKSLIALVGMIGLAAAAPAMAVQKCVALNSSTTCTSTPANWASKAEWEATCTTNGTSVPIKGVAACSNVAGSATGEIYSDGTLPTVSSASDTTNVNCWCKMTSPAVSSWVFNYADTSAGYCAYLCALNCAHRAAYFSAFRSALFSTMSD